MKKLKKYNKNLKNFSRENRKKMTPCEVIIWQRIRRKQLLGLQFYRQKPIFNYIVDFYCPRVDLIIEVDGSSHDESKYDYDKKREQELTNHGFKVLRFSDQEVKNNLEGIVASIYSYCERNLPNPL